jgi:isoleucyl-tRNA synthetase
VPFSTLDYRTNKDHWKEWYPADWISESFPGQFRNWFYSMIAMSAALEDSEPAKNVFSYALMRDEKGEEMHKSKGNAIWFEDAADKMGVDVMRWLFSRHTPANNLNFGYGPGDEVRRQFIIPLWNIYSFFTTYARLDGWTAERASDPGQRSELDRWILSELNLLVRRVTDYMENWRIEYSANAIEQFVDQLSNWYVRRSRRRFWKGEDDGDKQAAYSTLYQCLVSLSRLLAPYTPFLAEEMYQNLVARVVDEAPDSVHLADWPTADESLIDEELSNRTQLAIRIVSLGRSARAQSRLRVRQPLSELVVELRHDWERAALPQIADQVIEELNVKRLRDASEVGGRLLTFSVKPNLPKLGPKYGKDLGRIRKLLDEADASEIARSAESGRDVLIGDFTLEPDEVIVERSSAEGFAIASDAGYTAAVSTEITPELRAEGLAREVVHHVQNLRKSAGLEISDRIRLHVNGSQDAVDAIRSHESYVRAETLAIELAVGNGGTHSEAHNVDGESVTIGLEKA